MMMMMMVVVVVVVVIYSSLRVKHQTSYRYKTVSKITVLYILIFRFLTGNGKAKDSELYDSKHSWNLIFS
jgi:hypothetical protein